MKYASSIFAIAMLLPFAAQGAEPALPGVVWTSTVVKGGLDITSDTGQIEYEALEPDAEKSLQPEPISPARMQGRKPMIAVIVDDMGMDRAHTARALKLPPQVAVSYLPYSPEVRVQAEEAKASGHELVLHIPMQPERKTANPGPNFLGADMTPLELHTRILKNLEAFDGYAMVNNHMGSKFSRDRDGLGVLMSALAERKLMFLDSRTVRGSLAEKVAKEHGISATHRDVFLDNSEKPESVLQALAETERVARSTGTAIALGHPKAVTLQALEKWLPTLRAKGFDLVPLSQVIALRSTPKVFAPKIAVSVPAPVVALAPLPEVVVSEPVMPPEIIPAPPVAAKPVKVASTRTYGDDRTAGTIPVNSIQKRKTASAIADKYFLGRTEEKPVEEIIEEEKSAEVPAEIAAEVPVEVPAEKIAEKKEEKPYVDPLARVEAAAKEWEARKPQN